MENFLFNYYSISLLLGGVIALISGLIVFLNNKSRPDNKAWLLMTVCTSIWSFGYFAMTVSPDHEVAIIANDILHAAAILIPIWYLLLVLYITKLWKSNKQKTIFGIIFAIAFGFLFSLKNKVFVVDVIPKVDFNFAPVPGPLYKYFFTYFVIVVTYGIFLCLYKAREVNTEREKYRYYYVAFFTLAASVGGGSVFATTFNPDIAPYPLILFSIYPLISGYGILKHQLFDTKIVTTQLITFSLWMILLFRAFLSNSMTDLLINGGLFVLAVVFGTMLMRGVMREIKTKEALAEKEVELTRKNIELARISEEKTDFISIASHQIRGPLTSIKGYSSMILEGDFGKVPADVQNVAKIMIESCATLIRVVNDYLDVTRIEQGRMKFDFADVDLRELISTCVKELTPSMERAGLAWNVHLPDPVEKLDDAWWYIKGDAAKLKQIFLNLIDNSIKYTPKGSIAVSLMLADNKNIRFEVKDTGVGIAPETLPKLFTKFSRAEDASKTNILGTGLGLYVAKMMAEAFGGKIWAESEGNGKGARFVVELKGKRP